MYADYAFYTDTFYGTAISAADFPRLSSRASDFIDYYTRGKAEKATDESILMALSKACCAIAEQMQLDENNRALTAKAQTEALTGSAGEIKSESVGSWSASYTTAADYVGKDIAKGRNAEKAAYAAIAAEYLTNTGLLYRGRNCCGGCD